jgi:3-oxoacyl-[acyl-carrier protein] reductase
VNNAGVGRLVNSLDQPVDDIRKFLNVNIEGAINMVREVIPHIAEGGRIINITSIASKKAAGLMAVYSATKAGLDVLSYAWAEEVRVLWIHP